VIHPYTIWTVARCEFRLLWRSWAFRLFSALCLLFLCFFNFAVISPISNTPHYFRSVSGHLPLFNLKLFNLYQGVIAAFLSAEFIKRDRRQDTAQTIFVRSFTNLDYILGKLLGLFLLFAGLQLLLLGSIAAIHRFFATVPFAWQPYLLFPLFITLPTLIFTVGLTWLLISLLRNQALVFVCVLGISFLCFVLGARFYHFIDIFAFFLPLTYSDFIGLGNLDQLLFIRSTHVLFGLTCVSLTALLTPRLRQSRSALVVALLLALGSGAGATWIGITYIDQQEESDGYRQTLRAISRTAALLPAPKVTACSLAVNRPGRELDAAAHLTAVNPHQTPLDSLLFTLNPGLQVTQAKIDGRPARPSRDEHLLWLHPDTPLAPGDSCRLNLSYRGQLDQRFCYLDIDDERFTGSYQLWLFRPPKAYAFVGPEFLHLTPESGWYPVPGLSPGAAFPAATTRNYSNFQLSTTVPSSWTAFSQGAAVVDTADGELTYHFHPEQPLPQLSLTAGPYETRKIDIDDVTYSLAILPGHDYFEAYFDSIGPVLPETIRELKNDYEAALGLEYPYSRLSLVEVPIQFFSYRRLWTVAQEVVQPEILFLPEMGTLLEGADFRRMKRQSTRSQERANQAESAEQLQADYLRTLARLDFLGLQDPGTTNISQNRALEARWHLLPQYLSYVTHISSLRWPVLNYAFEAYFQERIIPPANTWSRRWRGLTDAERANLVLQQHSLSELLALSNEVEIESLEEEMEEMEEMEETEETEKVAEHIREAAIRARGRQLLLLLASRIGLEDFDPALTDFAAAGRHRAIDDRELLALLEKLGVKESEALFEAWYRTSDLPGYQVDGADVFLVRDGERTRTQVEMDLANPTDIDGLVKLNFRFRQDQLTSWWERQRAGWDFSRVVPLPARTRRKVGLLLDQPLAELIVDTYVARNIPSLIYFAYGEQTLRKDARPFSGFRDEPIAAADSTEIIIDNEDEGFELLAPQQTSRLRSFLLDLFDKKERREPYVGLNSWNPPGSWQATTDHRLYGRFVRSSYYKESGEGNSKVAWTTPITEEGDYDIYFFCGPTDNLPHKRGVKGKQIVEFLIYHEDGVDNLTVDRPELEKGWNNLGSFHLTPDSARVELTDRSTSRLVIADAVKWVKQ
jgi:ABC-type transport system involved in multi-copper enzyme maturation permease subunit